MEGLEAHHWPRDPLDEAMVLLNDVVQILDLPDLDHSTNAGEFQDHVHRLKARQIGAALVDDNPLGHAVRFYGLLEEAPGGGEIASVALLFYTTKFQPRRRRL